MQLDDNTALSKVIAWCTPALGPFEISSDHSRHPESSPKTTVRIGTPSGFCYIKIHDNEEEWAQEVHGYEQWARAFGNFVPQLLAVREEPPFALVTSECPGKILEDVEPAPSQERAVWRTAGEALMSLHKLTTGDYFGPCRRDGTCATEPSHDPVQYMSNKIQTNIEIGLREDFLTPSEQAVIHVALELTPSFTGQQPVPCHFDYCPANWLVTEDGLWSGVIDFERAHWDISVADFVRDPSWDWIKRPDLIEAFLEGYGYIATPETEQQLIVAHTDYALDTIVWASRVGFHGSLREGREALAHLAKQLL